MFSLQHETPDWLCHLRTLTTSRREQNVLHRPQENMSQLKHFLQKISKQTTDTGKISLGGKTKHNFLDKFFGKKVT